MNDGSTSEACKICFKSDAKPSERSATTLRDHESLDQLIREALNHVDPAQWLHDPPIIRFIL